MFNMIFVTIRSYVECCRAQTPICIVRIVNIIHNYTIYSRIRVKCNCVLCAKDCSVHNATTTRDETMKTRTIYIASAQYDRCTICWWCFCCLIIWLNQLLSVFCMIIIVCDFFGLLYILFCWCWCCCCAVARHSIQW